MSSASATRSPSSGVRCSSLHCSITSAWATPCTAAAACTHAPVATASSASPTPIGRSDSERSTARYAALRAPPPVRTSESSEPWIDRKASEQATRAAQARQVSGRRRFVDPATCERDYDAEEVELVRSLAALLEQLSVALDR